ncbi:hypothetical protein AB3N04_03305 [Alkalihalophilus sp. As8PL]|uniref:Uncharacterized protein n=1 Tax=Alkalihalophilus sp. As8PL TaxID=3237103 RepID=A0AB39BUV3_9BACI
MMLTLLFTEAIDQELIAPLPIEQLLSSYYCILNDTIFHLYFYNEHHFEDRMMNIWKTYWGGLCVEKEARLRVQ